MTAPRPPVPPNAFALPNSSRGRRRSSESSELSSERVLPEPITNVPVRKLARHTVGILLLLVTVVLWTASNFLASTIFADNTYSKPYFVTYVNSSFFSVFLVFVAVKRLWASGWSIPGAIRGQEKSTAYEPVMDEEEDAPTKSNRHDAEGNGHSPSSRLMVDDSMTSAGSKDTDIPDRLNIRETAWLSFEFCILWFLANYFIAACLEYTTVASSTIISSTSSIWTLMIGAFLKVELFTVRKLIGTLASLAGIVLISSVDLTGNNDQDRGDFPHKSHRELAIGDILALISAVLYGVYTTMMKKRIGDESRVDMPLFFGFVGLFNLATLLPGFFILHFTGIETFELPPTRRITTIVLVNSVTSLVSDLSWAYSMLLTSPLVVTVGLSLTIPLSLFGQMVINSQTSSAMYWVGAIIVLLSFVFINYESKEKGEWTETDMDNNQDRQVVKASNFAWRIWRRIVGGNQ